MIDTIKVGIPLTRSQHLKLQRLVRDSDLWQWIKVNEYRGEILFKRQRGLAELSQASYHRAIFWDIPVEWEGDRTRLTCELSLPKFWSGHNCYLLYDSYRALLELRADLCKQLRLRLPDPLAWQVFRADLCYAWQCPNQETAKALLESVKHLTFPRKKKTIYADSIFFSGGSYAVKLYLKLPEFENHDRRDLLKSGARLEWIEYLEQLAEGVIRFEVSMKRNYLKSHKKVETVAQLLEDKCSIEPDAELQANHPDELKDDLCRHLMLMFISNYTVISGENKLNEKLGKECRFIAPPGVYQNQQYRYNHKGGGFIYRRQAYTVVMLQEFMSRLVGSYKGMSTFDKVEKKLEESYQSSKALRLLGFWMYVQKFGVEKAKSKFSEPTFYRNRSDLRDAGVSLVGPVKSDKVVWLDEFRWEIPSDQVVNRFDAFRDSDSLLNLVESQTDASGSSA